MMRGAGCSFCNKTGFQGRIGIFEVFETDEEIRALIMQKSNAELIEKQAHEDGMISMLEDGIIKAIEGLSTIDEILRNATTL